MKTLPFGNFFSCPDMVKLVLGMNVRIGLMVFLMARFGGAILEKPLVQLLMVMRIGLVETYLAILVMEPTQVSGIRLGCSTHPYVSPLEGFTSYHVIRTNLLLR